MNGLTTTEPEQEQVRLLRLLERLLTMQGIEVKPTLAEAAQLLVEAMHADKIDIFILDPATETQIALGVSNTPMGARQRAIGLDRLPLANGGREAEVYHTGQPYLSGHVDLDTGVLKGFRFELGVRSMIIVPLDVAGERRGTIQACSQRSEAFTPQDVAFVQVVAGWIGLVFQRARLVEHLTQTAAEQARRGAADELITVLAHDLNNHLTPIQGRVSLLRRRAVREDRPQDLADINVLMGAVERLSNLVSDLLDVERLEQKLFDIDRHDLDLAALIEETVSILATPERPIELHVRTQHPARVLVDPARMRQALENVLSNATKHSPLGVAVMVLVETEQREEGRWVVVTVHDSGPGVPAEIVPRLFSRFAAGPGSSGLGLGLYMARSITEAHGGTLRYDPTTQGGATFRLELPLRASERAEHPLSEEPDQPRATEAAIEQRHHSPERHN
jgi:signal transduction histidine kinase